MALHEYLLSNDVRSRLDQIAFMVSKDKLLRNSLRASFRLFLGRIGVHLKSYQITRIFDKPSSVRYEHMVYYFDFITDHNAEDQIKELGKESLCNRLFENIKEMNRISTEPIDQNLNLKDKITDILDIGKYAEKVPDYYYGEYIGYRRSANKNDIVRFTFDIKKTDNEMMVDYENEYMRVDLRWNAIGFGISVNNTLYLIGHACGKETKQSLGLRFMAMKQIGTTDILTALLISMDNDMKIIAARIVLVPRQKHKFDERYQNLDEDSFVSEIVKGTLDQERLLDEIPSHLGDLFEGNDAEYLFQLIRNRAFSGLKLVPSDFDTEIARLARIMHGGLAGVAQPIEMT